MDIDEILENHSLNRKIATNYIDAITRRNQSQTAEEIGVSRDTVNRYKKAFNKMSEKDRAHLIAALANNKFLQIASED